MKPTTIAGLCAAVVTVAAASNFHIVRGSNNHLGTFIPKVSWSLSETLINLDEVGNLPAIAARSQYPLFMAALERDISASSRPAFTRSRLERILVGMGQAEVEGILGKPDHSYGDPGKEETVTYFDSISGTSATLKYDTYQLMKISH